MFLCTAISNAALDRLLTGIASNISACNPHHSKLKTKQTVR
jgi:hypothetical protein